MIFILQQLNIFEFVEGFWSCENPNNNNLALESTVLLFLGYTADWFLCV